MNVKAKIGAWSSVVGGGVLLIGEDGRMIGQIAFLCHDDRLRERGMQEKLAQICCDAINTRATPDPLSDPRVKALMEKMRDWEARIEDCEWSANSSLTEDIRAEMRAALRAIEEGE